MTTIYPFCYVTKRITLKYCVSSEIHYKSIQGKRCRAFELRRAQREDTLACSPVERKRAKTKSKKYCQPIFRLRNSKLYTRHGCYLLTTSNRGRFQKLKFPTKFAKQAVSQDVVATRESTRDTIQRSLRYELRWGGGVW